MHEPSEAMLSHSSFSLEYISFQAAIAVLTFVDLSTCSHTLSEFHQKHLDDEWKTEEADSRF